LDAIRPQLATVLDRQRELACAGQRRVRSLTQEHFTQRISTTSQAQHLAAYEAIAAEPAARVVLGNDRAIEREIEIGPLSS
jgi:hypothetical protein